MPKQGPASDYEIITDGGRRRRWSSAEKLRIVEETLENGASISVVVRCKAAQHEEVVAAELKDIAARIDAVAQAH